MKTSTSKKKATKKSVKPVLLESAKPKRYKARTFSPRLESGYMSRLEERIAKQLEADGIPFKYEEETISYEVPARKARYTYDFVLPNRVIVEGKGLFEAKDRQKHLLIKEQYPDLDIRFVFQNPDTKIRKGSPTSYADWCKKHGFLYAKGTVPKEWYS